VKLHIPALALTAGLFWGFIILIVGLSQMIWSDYGSAFLNIIGSIYPGYRPGSGIGSVITGTLYGLVDGTIGGAIFAWLYNLLASKLGNGKA